MSDPVGPPKNESPADRARTWLRAWRTCGRRPAKRAAIRCALALALMATACSEPEVESRIGSESLCSLEGLTNLPASHPECLFFTGTQHYRNERWADAVAAWTAVLEIENLPAEHVGLRIDVLNNLGYMYFFGFGIGEDKPLALQYWTNAVAMGHAESEYHLCHAYADRQEPTFDIRKARSHCNRAEAFYGAIAEPDEDQKAVLKMVREYQSQLLREPLVERPG